MLTLDETAWLLRLCERTSGRRPLAGLGISDPMLDSLIDKGLVDLQHGILQVTARGMAKARRLLEE
jgi:hypothetical protein